MPSTITSIVTGESRMPATPIKYTPKKGALARVEARTPEESRLFSQEYQDDLKARHKLVTPHLGREALMSTESTNWALHGVIQDKALNLLFGEPETYKTFLALDWAFTLNAEQDTNWLGHKRTKRYKPLYLFTEGKAGLKKRMLAWESHKEQITEDESGIVWVFDRVDLMQQAPPRTQNAQMQEIGINLATEPQVKLREIYESYGCDMLIIDTLRNTIGGDENSNADVGRYMNTLDEYVDDGPVLLIHHTRKGDKKTYSGATALRGQPDVMLCSWKEKETDLIATLEHSKFKDGEKMVIEQLRPKVIVTGQYQDEDITSVVLINPTPQEKNLTPNQEQVIASLRVFGVPTTSKDVAIKLGRTVQSIDGDLRNIAETGRIIKDDGRPALWSLAPEPEEI